MVARLDLKISCFDYIWSQWFVPRFDLIAHDADLDWCRRSCMVIFTGSMWKRWNGSWFQVLTVLLLVVHIRQLLGRIISIYLVVCKTLPQYVSESCELLILLHLMHYHILCCLGGEFTSPNQERFHHYKVKPVLNCFSVYFPLLYLFFLRYNFQVENSFRTFGCWIWKQINGNN